MRETDNEQIVRIILGDFQSRMVTVIKNTADYEKRYREALDLLAYDILQLLNDQKGQRGAKTPRHNIGY